ncbi:MAG: hypothetical protein EOO88_34060 [Pedobacter sp.]|nr:MAG: hypothetical protein EOO88_34060 [Pedobacter sp.]
MFNQKTIGQILSGIIFLLVLLWVYTAASKLSDITEFKRQLNSQTFSHTVAALLLWLIPISELCAAVLLMFKQTLKLGLILSLFLMILFTAYIALVLAGYYDRIPCSCGGVLQQLGWQAHLYFNLFFLTLSIIGLLLLHKQKVLLRN